MKSTNRSISVLSLALAAALSVLAGCQKKGLEGQNLNDGTVKYSVVLGHSTETDDLETKSAKAEVQSSGGSIFSLIDKSGKVSLSMKLEVSEFTGTKGELINTSGNEQALSQFKEKISEFHAVAYDGYGQEKVNQDVQWSDDKNAWVATPVAYWPLTINLTFFSCANLPEGQETTIDHTGVSMLHSVSASAANQTDILFGHYRGNGGNTGTAEIRFEHPMTAVRFLRGEMSESLVIKSISIEGVAKSGTVTMTSDGEFVWSGMTDYSHIVSQTGEAGSGLKTSVISGYSARLLGDAFLIIPQTFSESQPVVISVVVSNVGGEDNTLQTSISAGSWLAGKTNTYTLNYIISPVSVSINKSGLHIEDDKIVFSKGDIYSLAATVLPDDATNKRVTWTSSNTDVAVIDAVTGELTAVGGGETTITVTTVEGGKTDNSIVKVIVPASGVSLNKKSLSLVSNDVTKCSETLIATVNPADATNKEVEWQSSNPSVATVDATGKVTAVGNGTATITVNSKADPTKTAVCDVTVTTAVTSVMLNKSNLALTIKGSVIGSETLIATVNPADATNKEVEWQSSNPSVATVDATGKVTAVGNGTATITVNSKADPTKKATCTVTVTINVTGVSVSLTSLTLIVGQSQTLSKTIYPLNATNQNVTWNSDNNSVASVNSNGLVTATAIGTANITVTTEDGGYKATCTVIVNKTIDASGNLDDFSDGGTYNIDLN